MDAASRAQLNRKTASARAAAPGAGRARADQVEGLVVGRGGGLLVGQQGAAFALPLALHHHRQPVDDDIEKAAYQQTEQARDGDPDGRVLLEEGLQFGHVLFGPGSGA
jgi:hypothetical protein